MHTENRFAPRVIAHRAGGGQWPQNSRTAVLSSIARAQAGTPQSRYDGMESSGAVMSSPSTQRFGNLSNPFSAPSSAPNTAPR